MECVAVQNAEILAIFDVELTPDEHDRIIQPSLLKTLGLFVRNQMR